MNDNTTSVTRIDTDPDGVVTRIEFVENGETIAVIYEKTGPGPRNLKVTVNELGCASALDGTPAIR